MRFLYRNAIPSGFLNAFYGLFFYQNAISTGFYDSKNVDNQ